MASGEGDSCIIEFRSFDIESDVVANHYGKSSRSCSANANGSLHRKIMKEWKILESDLPDSIYVRTYETRIDLLRAVIIGASGTPYHDGLFFFDIQFPSDYPKHPPMVYYHSHGLRLNPNLYANGMVCLSLINTWFGSKVEKWAPTKSTILQLLVSIQGLVLNEKPYFNEPGKKVAPNKLTPKIIKKYMDYNENAFLLSCKTMLNVMNNPPKHFESFVAGHFRRRAGHILAAIGAYRDGRCLVGTYTEDASYSSKPYEVSPQFKENLEKYSAALEMAFKKMGKIAPTVNNSKRTDIDLQAKIAAIQTEAKIGPSCSAKPEEAVGKPKSSTQKGVWKKLISPVAWIFK